MSHRPADVAPLTRAAVLTETIGDVRREITQAAGTGLHRRTAHLHVLILHIVQYLINNNTSNNSIRYSIINNDKTI